MVDQSSEPAIKLVDFGLSKTFAPGETCKEPFGTLCYVAPEILLQKSYDKSVDFNQFKTYSFFFEAAECWVKVQFGVNEASI